jgi:hypothetical protein
MSSNPNNNDTHADFGAIRVPGSRPHDGRNDDWGPYPQGWKGIIAASIAKRTVFRTGWNKMNTFGLEVDASEIMIPVSHRQPPAVENIRSADTK